MRIILTLFLLIGICISIFANGGPTEYVGIKSTGSISLSNVKDVSLIKEDLNITPEKEEVNVQVTYYLKSNREIKNVKFGFPFKINDNSSPVKNSSNDHDSFMGWINTQWIKDYSVTFNNKNIKSFLKKNLNKINNTIWKLSKLTFQKGLNVLKIQYKIKPLYWYEASPTMPHVLSDPSFNYNFKPAAGWGNGTVREINITLNLSKINIPGMEIYFSGLMKTSTKKNNIYTLKLSNVNLNKIKDIDFSYTFNDIYSKFRYSLFNRKTKALVKKIEAANSLGKKYSVDKLVDGKLNTAWVEGDPDDGIGKWIEIHFDDSKGIRHLPKSIAIVNGYYKSERLYYANRRLKSIKLVVTFKKYVHFSKKTSIETKEKTFHFYDKTYVKPTPENIKKYLTFLYEGSDFNQHYIEPEDRIEKGITKVFIQILSTYPGAKYDDTCISEIIAY